MPKKISKSQFEPRSLEYLRRVQQTREELVITEHGSPVLKIIPYQEDAEVCLSTLRKTVMRYEEPLEPVDFETETNS